jgi:hypothetical protein
VQRRRYTSTTSFQTSIYIFFINELSIKLVPQSLMMMMRHYWISWLFYILLLCYRYFIIFLLFYFLLLLFSFTEHFKWVR